MDTKKKKKTRFITTILVVLTVILFLMVTPAILTIGGKFSALSPWAGYLFYAFAAVLAFVFIVLPFIKTVAAPAIPDFLTKDFVADKEAMKFILKNSKNSSDPQIEEKAPVWKKEYRDDPQKARAIRDEYISLVDKAITGIINAKTRDTFFLTGVSQKGSFDLLICIMINISMIYKIVKVSCRPNFRQLLEMYWRILIAAYVAMASQTVLTALKSLNIGSAVAKAFTQISGIIVGSLASGAINAIQTSRIGHITKAYILSGGNQEAITKDASKILIEANKNYEKVESENKAKLDELQKELSHQRHKRLGKTAGRV
jgi:hypothetical protein